MEFLLVYLFLFELVSSTLTTEFFLERFRGWNQCPVMTNPESIYQYDQTWIDDNPYAFHMFENDQGNRKVFVKEQKVHKLTKKVRSLLFKAKKRLKSTSSKFNGKLSKNQQALK